MASLDPVDAALATALGVDGRQASADGPGLLTIDELAEQAEVPVSVLEAIEREGMLVPHPSATGEARFAATDAPTVRAAMRLLETGMPLAEFLDLARRADRALRDLATEAVEAFLLYVRDPVRGRDASTAAGAELVDAFQTMLPATEDLVGGHFRALVLATARERMAEAIAGADDRDDERADQRR